MKKNRIFGILIFICIIVLVILTASMLIKRYSSKQINNMVNDTYNTNSDDVDSGVKYFMSSKEYKNMSKDEQIDNMGDLLNLYEDNHVIKNLHYDEAGMMYTFTYNIGDIKGSLGGIMLKDLHPMMN